MTESTPKTRKTEEKSPVEVHRKNPEHWIFGGLVYLRGFIAGLSAVLMARIVDITAPIAVLLIV